LNFSPDFVIQNIKIQHTNCKNIIQDVKIQNDICTNIILDMQIQNDIINYTVKSILADILTDIDKECIENNTTLLPDNSPTNNILTDIAKECVENNTALLPDNSSQTDMLTDDYDFITNDDFTTSI